MKPTPLLLLISTLLSGPHLLPAADSTGLNARLHGTGVPAASGTVLATLGQSRSDLHVSCRGLAAVHAYTIEIAGIAEVQATSDRHGRLKVHFRTSAPAGTPALDFDPRGAVLRVLDGAASAAEGVIAELGEDSGATETEHTALRRSDDAPAAAKATAHFSHSRSGRETVSVELSGLDDTPLKVLVDGVERGEVHRHGRHGAAKLDSGVPREGESEGLEFEVRGSEIEIAGEDRVLFSGRLAAQIPGVNVAAPSAFQVALTPQAAAGSGTASARLRIDERARKHLSVELQSVPAGEYSLFAGETPGGTIQVAAVTGGTAGELEMSAGDDDPRELPLTFDPLGAVLSIRQGATLFFQGSLMANVSGSGAPAPAPASQFSEVLTSTGLDADATGRARYRVDDQGRHKFTVEIEKVPAGTYTLTVGGKVGGRFAARQTAAGQAAGEIEFATRGRRTVRESESGGHGGNGGDDGGGDDNGGGTPTGGGGTDDGGGNGGNDDAIDGHELALTFDPRGQTIEISSVAGVCFSHLLGSGSAGQAGTPAAAFATEAALLNSGAVPGAKAKAEFRQRESGALRFEVEVEDAPAGDYQLYVGGTLRGTLTVTASSGRGELEFESANEAGQPKLDFPVLGQPVELLQGQVTHFSRLFPSE